MTPMPKNIYYLALYRESLPHQWQIESYNGERNIQMTMNRFQSRWKEWKLGSVIWESAINIVMKYSGWGT
jgi:hypothetical protein